MNLRADSRVHSHAVLRRAEGNINRALSMTVCAGSNRSPPSTRRLLAKASEHPAVLRARAYLDASAGPVSLDALAGTVRLSKSHLARLFRNQVGLPPHAYSLRLRLAKACGLLAEGVPIAEVAQVAGFADQSHLTRHFKGRLGLTPGEYVRTLVRTETRGDPKTA